MLVCCWWYVAVCLLAVDVLFVFGSGVGCLLLLAVACLLFLSACCSVVGVVAWFQIECVCAICLLLLRVYVRLCVCLTVCLFVGVVVAAVCLVPG